MRFQDEIQISAPRSPETYFPHGKIRDVELDGILHGVHTKLAIAAKRDRTDITRRDTIRFHSFDNSIIHLIERITQIHAIDFRGIEHTLHVVLQAEDRRTLLRLVTANALKHRRAVVDDMGHHMNIGLVPGNQFSIVPDVFRRL